jgi:hypothetical protein
LRSPRFLHMGKREHLLFRITRHSYSHVVRVDAPSVPPEYEFPSKEYRNTVQFRKIFGFCIKKQGDGGSPKQQP